MLPLAGVMGTKEVGHDDNEAGDSDEHGSGDGDSDNDEHGGGDGDSDNDEDGDNYDDGGGGQDCCLNISQGHQCPLPWGNVVYDACET